MSHVFMISLSVRPPSTKQTSFSCVCARNAQLL